MPVYEFYCEDCHTIFSFFSRGINTDKQPDCPKCGKAGLERKMSVFAFSKGRSEDDNDPMANIDENALEKVMGELATEMDGVSEDDPRAMAKMMRKLYDATGMNLGSGVEEAIGRLEAGEDPDKIEAELGDVFDSEAPFAVSAKKQIKDLRNRILPPNIDETLYDL